jgi:hypothetical protein
MNIFEFMGEHPVLTFFLVFIFFRLCIVLPNRIMRHANIRKHGYPPSHCDADGDQLEKD